MSTIPGIGRPNPAIACCSYWPETGAPIAVQNAGVLAVANGAVIGAPPFWASVKKLEQRADFSIEREDHHNALERLNEALNLFKDVSPNEPGVNLVQARLLRKTGQVYKAIEAPELHLHEVLNAALALLADAEIVCNKSLQTEPSGQTSLLLAYIYEERGTVQLLMQDFNAGLDSHKKAADILTGAMSAYIADESLSEQVLVARAGIFLKIAQMLVEKKRMDTALLFYKKAACTHNFLADLYDRRIQKAGSTGVPALLRKQIEQSLSAVDMFKLAGIDEQVDRIYNERLIPAVNYLVSISRSRPVEYIESLIIKGMIYRDIANTYLAFGYEEIALAKYRLALHALETALSSSQFLKCDRPTNDVQVRLLRELSETNKAYHEIIGTADHDLLDPAQGLGESPLYETDPDSAEEENKAARLRLIEILRGRMI